jgi:hypothetical protein
MTALLVLVSLYLVFFMYLMFAGAGLMRTLSVLRVAAWQSSLAGLVVGLVVALFSVAAAAQTFLTVMTLMSLVLLPTASLSRARDFILPNSSAIEAVCLNVLVLAMGEPSRSFAFFDTFFQAGYHLLLNPFALLVPPSLGLALSLWPSVLALRAAAQGPQASRRSRFFLNLWVQLMSIFWVLPAAIGTFRRFNADSWQDYVEAVFACLGLVYVVLTWMTLRDAVFGKRTAMEGEVSVDSTAGIGVARALADRMDVGRLHPRVLVAAGLLTYVAIWLSLLHSLDREVAASAGFIVIVVAGALLSRDMGRPASEIERPSLPRSAWVVSALALIALMGLIRPLSLRLFAARQQAVFSLESAEVRQATDLRAVDASQRLCGYRWDGMHMLHCPLSNRAFVWSAFTHPPHLSDPIGFNYDEAQDHALSFGERRVNCAQMLAHARMPDGEVREVVMLVVYMPDAKDGSQYAWLYEPHAACARVVEVIRPAESRIGPGFGYLWEPEVAAARKERMAWLGELEDTSQPVR